MEQAVLRVSCWHQAVRAVGTFAAGLRPGTCGIRTVSWGVCTQHRIGGVAERGATG